MVYHEDSFLYFGGDRAATDSVIAKFDLRSRNWSHLGYLKAGRSGHGAVFEGSHFLIIGGTLFNDREQSEPARTEKCNLSNSSISCVEQQPELTSYSRYPELFIVADNFCKNT